VLASPDTSRDVLINWIRARKDLTRAGRRRPAQLAFRPGEDRRPGGVPLGARQAGAGARGRLDNVSELRADDGLGKGYALYAVDLGK
jgi:2',3'-cyclic-nucleotide 2'-phosphodiesterase/3'-nucleotidase